MPPGSVRALAEPAKHGSPPRTWGGLGRQAGEGHPVLLRSGGCSRRSGLRIAVWRRSRDRARLAHGGVAEEGDLRVTNDRYRLAADAVRLPFRSDGCVLCVRRAAGADPAPGQLAVVGDNLEESESLDQAARGEARVAAGVDTDPRHQKFCGLVHDDDPLGEDRISTVFVAQSWSGEPHNAEPDRHDGPFRAALGKPSHGCNPCTVAIFRMVAEGPTCLTLSRPVPARGGAS
ncbi:NUDIX domain-containing protein [Streptomyces sp. NPDC051286]|uniref:NUDIX domain-containing protein n=1 Tax=Streptomyces sp. NPDC051286 TaxID=3365647 RepID=UPI0037B04C30